MPTAKELQTALDRRGSEALRAVEFFTVGKHGVGSITWDGLTDLTTVGEGGLDAVVNITKGEVAVYSGVAAAGKPPRGRGLNAPAEITLHGIFCQTAPVANEEEDWDADGGVLMDSEERLRVFTRRLMTAPGTDFVSYDAREGVWKFRVKHFSKYGLDVSDSDDSDSDEDEAADAAGGGGGAGGDVGMRESTASPAPMAEVVGAAQQQGIDGKGSVQFGFASGEIDPATQLVLRDTPKPAYAAPAANDLFGQPTAGEWPEKPRGASPFVPAPAAGAGAGVGVGGYVNRSFDRQWWPPSATTGVAAAAAASDARSSNAFKRREPPMQTAYAVAASVAGAARRLDLPARPRAGRELLTDAHSMFGAAFRPSWGPGGRLVHAGRTPAAAAAAVGGYPGAARRAAAEGGPRHAPSAAVVVERFSSSSAGRESARTEAMVKAKRGALEVALAHTVAVGLPAPSTPGRQPTAAAAAAWTDASEHGPRLRFECTRLGLPELCLQHLSAVECAVTTSPAGAKDATQVADELAAEVRVWDLLSVLYGDVQGGAPRGSAADRHRRRAGLSAWLRKHISREQRRAAGDGSYPAGSAGAAAAAGRAVKGAVAAVRARDPRLATLIAQSNAGGRARELAAAQLDVWRGSPVDAYLTDEARLVFSLLAGEVAPPPPNAGVSGWCQNLGLHMWYAHPPTVTFACAIERYLQSIEKGEAAYPTAPGLPAVDPDVSRLKDMSFNLLTLASAGEVPADANVAAIFHPLTYNADDLTNAALAWHLFVTLRAVGALPDSPENVRLADNIHVAFAQQLLAMGDGGGGVGGGGGALEGRRGGGRTRGRDVDKGDGSMVEWAAYVAMHVEDGPRRREVVAEMLHRRCADWCDDAEKTAFLRTKLGVPESWLEDAMRHWASYNWWDPETAF